MRIGYTTLEKRVEGMRRYVSRQPLTSPQPPGWPLPADCWPRQAASEGLAADRRTHASHLAAPCAGACGDKRPQITPPLGGGDRLALTCHILLTTSRKRIEGTTGTSQTLGRPPVAWPAAALPAVAGCHQLTASHHRPPSGGPLATRWPPDRPRPRGGLGKCILFIQGTS